MSKERKFDLQDHFVDYDVRIAYGAAIAGRLGVGYWMLKMEKIKTPVVVMPGS